MFLLTSILYDCGATEANFRCVGNKFSMHGKYFFSALEGNFLCTRNFLPLRRRCNCLAIPRKQTCKCFE